MIYTEYDMLKSASQDVSTREPYINPRVDTACDTDFDL